MYTTTESTNPSISESSKLKTLFCKSQFFVRKFYLLSHIYKEFMSGYLMYDYCMLFLHQVFTTHKKNFWLGKKLCITKTIRNTTKKSMEKFQGLCMRWALKVTWSFTFLCFHFHLFSLLFPESCNNEKERKKEYAHTYTLHFIVVVDVLSLRTHIRSTHPKYKYETP